MDAVTAAQKEQIDNGYVSTQTAIELISANASLAQYLTQTANGYLFDAEAARQATYQEMLNAFTKYDIASAAVAAANGNYVFAMSAIAASNATKEEKEEMIGLLNAFAIRFSGNNYIAIYSDVFEMMNSDIDTLKYIIGHELGHVKRMHMSKRFWTLLSSVVPFLSSAYSRSCEYTCDNIGLAVSSSDCRRALVLLAAGKNLYKQVDIENLILDSKSNNTLSVKIMGCFMSHPYLPKRIENLERILNRKA